MAQTLPNYVPSNGLVGWWPFSGNANDESGNGNNGTISGATLTTDRFGAINSCYSFNGTNNKIVIQNTLMSNTFSSHSTSVWIKTSSQSNQMIYSDRGPNGGYPNYFWYKNSSMILSNGTWNHVSHNNNCTNNATSQSQSVSDNIWHNLVSVFDAQQFTIKLYQDGVLVKTQSGITSNCYGNLSQPTTIGCYSGGGYADQTFFNGLIDDIGIWNRALTQQEINELYNAVNCANNTIISPQVNLLLTGNTATFAASTSDASPTYLWQSDFGQGFVTLNNFGMYSGVNTSMLSIANIQLANHNQPIRAISTSGNCVDTSNVANINIADTCINTSIVTVYDTTFVTVTDTNYVTIYDTITNYISVTDTLFIDINTVGLNNATIINTIKVFPNPTNSYLNMDYGNYANLDGYSVKIINALSQVIYNQPITQQTETINLSAFGGNGIYYLNVINPQGNIVEVRKIVLQ